jgi:purine-cytosine permease-like protein
VLNIIIMIGYCVISCILGGYILSAVSGGSMSVVIGIFITALINWLVTVLGMTAFHIYERYVLELLSSSQMIVRWDLAVG